MKLIAIETSCDETAAAVVSGGREVLSSVVASQVEEHIIYGGVVPEIASRRHVEAISGVVSLAMRQAGMTYDRLDGVAVTYAPGLIGALLVGVNFAKGLSYAAGLPLVPVHHLRAHAAANYISSPDLEPPFLCLIVSGGHSHIVEVKDYTDFHVIGRTRDDAAGECLDKAARAMGLPYPGGQNLDKAAAGGDPLSYSLPHPSVQGSEYDFSFSGLKTAAVNIIHKAKQRGEDINVPDLGASYIKAVTDCLVERTEKAASAFAHKKIALAGGVSANSVLRREMTEMCKRNKLELFMPPPRLCGDNAAMVGAQGYFELLKGNIAPLSLNAIATAEI